MTQRRRRDDFDLILAHRGRKRKRADRIKRRRRTGVVAATIVLVLAAMRCGGRPRRWNGALRELQPEHAPSRRDRPELVRLRIGRVAARLDPGRAKPRAGHHSQHVAVAAAIDDRDRRPPFLGARRRRLRRHRTRCLEGPHGGQGPRGRLDDHATARAQSLHRPGEDAHAQDQGSLPGDQAREQVAEAEDPQRVPEHGLLRQSRVRRRGCLADVLLQARERADAAPGGAARRLAAGPVGLRPVPQSAGGARPARRGAARSARQQRHHARAVPERDPLELARPEARAHLHAHQAALFLLVRDRRARAAVRREYGARGRAEGLHDDRSASTAPGGEGDPRCAAVQDRPRRGDRLRPAGNRCDSRDDGRGPQHRQPVQPRRSVRAASGVDVQDIRARVRDRERRRSRLDLLHVGSVHVLDRAVVPAAVGGAHVRQRRTQAPSR